MKDRQHRTRTDAWADALFELADVVLYVGGVRIYGIATGSRQNY